MKCTDLETLTRLGQLAARRADPPVVDHLRECASCRVLYGDGSQLGELLCELPRFDVENQHAEIANLLWAEDRSWSGRLKALPSWSRHGLLFAFGLTLLILTFYGSRRADFEFYPLPRMLIVVSTLMALTAFSVRETLLPLSRPITSARPWLLLVSLGLPWGVAVLPEVAGLEPFNRGSEPVWLGALPCFGIGTAVAASVACVWRLLDRGGGRRLWLLVASLGGLVGNAVLQLHCPVTTVAHLALGHAGIGVALGVIGLTLQRVVYTANR